MFQTRTTTSGFQTVIVIFELIYHSVVRNVQKTHGNAFMALVMSMTQTVTFVLTFYVMFDVLGLRGSLAIRGDFMIYIMSGIFMFLTHIKAINAVFNAEGPASPMMKHAPMNTIISIAASALSALYIQILSVSVILFLYHVLYQPISLENPIGCLGMLLLSWFTGCGIGLIFFAAKPWAPGTIATVQQVYSRANMIASGKMFVANQTPGYVLALFTWNPLFHTIDQARGFAFVNYNPHHSNWEYSLKVGIVCFMIGLMGEFVTRRRASLSWSAGR